MIIYHIFYVLFFSRSAIPKGSPTPTRGATLTHHSMDVHDPAGGAVAALTLVLPLLSCDDVSRHFPLQKKVSCNFNWVLFFLGNRSCLYLDFALKLFPAYCLC